MCTNQGTNKYSLLPRKTNFISLKHLVYTNQTSPPPILPLPVIVKSLQLYAQDLGQSLNAHPLDRVHLFVTFFTMIGIGPLKQVSLDKRIQRFKQVLLVADVHVEGCEWFLTAVPVKKQNMNIVNSDCTIKIWIKNNKTKHENAKK